MLLLIDHYVSELSKFVDAPEAALRLIITLLAGYPIAFIYKIFIQNRRYRSIHHLFFAICGINLCLFNYGLNTCHSFLAIFVTHMFFRLFRSSFLMMALTFIFNMTYLLVGYYYTESNEYDILWTMPHCVLTLRMIGLAFDIYDGNKRMDELSADQKESVLGAPPTLLELYAYAYFPASFLVGPQFPYRRYQRFINGEFREYSGAVSKGLTRLLVGLTYLAIRQAGSRMLPDAYFLSDTFANKFFIIRIIELGLWGKFTLYKYISCWLITEGALITLGLSYRNQTQDWYGCSNVNLWLLESGLNMQHYVLSFNVNTNLWVSQYIYKRLKFLRSRELSYAGALIFLAVWHGFHSGYYMSFALEFVVVTTEKQIAYMYKNTVQPFIGSLGQQSLYKLLLVSVLKTYNVVFMGWCLAPFTFLHFARWWRVFSAVNFYGFIWLAGWQFIFWTYKQCQRPIRK